MEENCREIIMSEQFADFILGYDKVEEFTKKGACIQKVDENYDVVYLNRNEIPPLTVDNYSYFSFPKCYTIIDYTSLEVSGILRIQNQPALALKGSGVLIGFIDTGIDYQNRVFQRSDGSTRIEGIWDQTVNNGIVPEGFLYGSEYRQEEINKALQSQTPYQIVPSMDVNGHGTAVASIAAGSKVEVENFSGAAPESSIGVVKLKQAKKYLKEFYRIRPDALVFQENDMMTAIQYLDSLATSLNKPLVICIALGTNMGDHSSGSPLTYLINKFSVRYQRSVVIGTGNEANQRHHFYGSIAEENGSEDVEIRCGEDSYGFSLELWGRAPDVYTISIVSPTGESVPRISAQVGKSEVYTFVFSNTKIHVDYRVAEIRSNDQLIMIRFSNPIPGLWTIRVFGNNLLEGHYNMWLPMTEFLSADTIFIRSNPDITLTDPSVALLPITVGGYNARNDSIFLESGRGYTRTGAVKPDISAPAVDVSCVFPKNRYSMLTGTSASAAITAGAAVLIMEWGIIKGNDLRMNTGKIKNYLIRGANREKDILFPNREWGYGTLDLYESFRYLKLV